MCYSPALAFTRRGLNLDLTTTRSGAPGSLVFFNEPAEIGFNPDTHILLYRVEAVTAVLGEDLDEAVWLLLGDAVQKGEEIQDELELVVSVHAIDGRKGEAIQVLTKFQPQIWLTYRNNVKNVAIMLRDCSSGHLIHADVTAKVSFKSKTIASNE